jgi:eukaryotic-like serine/threonine-protein kinase
MPEEKIPHYRILEKIGGGGMGVVYKAEDTRLHRNVALKFLPEEIAHDHAAISRFRREAQAASALNHRNICTIYDIGEQDGKAFIAMEFLDGRTLKEVIGGKPLPEHQVLDLSVGIADGLEAAHSKGIVHRDIKPANIFVGEGGQVKILDFGLAKLASQTDADATLTLNSPGELTDDQLTLPGTAIGTVAYMSPEQVRGEGLDARTDLFSFGVVLYEMATGRQAFPGLTSGVITDGILNHAPAPLRRVIPHASRQLQDIISKALEKDRNLRYQTAADLRADLQGLKDGADVRYQHASEIRADLKREIASKPVLAGPEAISAKYSRRFVWSFSAIAAALVVGLTLLGWHSLVSRFSRNPSMNSIAVLPFANASNNPEMDYWGEGMSEEITNSLSRLPNLTVMARSTVSRYKSRQDDPQSVGRDLHVDAVLTGRVAERGSDLTVDAELVNVATGAQLWGERYTRSASDASLLQSAITSDVASQLAPQITRNERDKVATAGTRDGEAYQLYLKGRYHASKSTAEGLKKGIEYFQQAIDKDPGDALAYAGLADAYVRLGGGFGYALQNDVFPKAEAASIRALEIDDTLVEAHAAFGSVKALYKWDWTGAETEYKRALALGPNNAQAHNRYGQFLVWTGRDDGGITENKRAQDLDPLSPMIAGDLGYEYMVAGRYDESILQCKKAIELEPSAMWLHAYLAWAYARKGDYAQAISEHEKMGSQGHEVSAENQLIASGLGWIYAVAGRRRDAEKVLEQFNSISSDPTVDPYWVAAVHAGLGDKGRAFELLEKSYRQHSANLAYIKPDPFWDNLHFDSRYLDLLRRMGLPQ